MKDAFLCRYFTDAPGWQRQLAQLRKKCLAGYADGVICLRDASKEECCAAEGCWGVILYRHSCAIRCQILRKRYSPAAFR